jgi:signal transduction histidine kinase
MNSPSTAPVRGGPRIQAADPYLRARDERLESLKAVVGKLAHDFNNFLVPQFGYITLLRDEVAGSLNAAKYLEAMESAGRKSEAYIASILLGMRPHRQFSPKDFSFSGLLNSILDIWEQGLPANAGIQVERAIGEFTFRGDERQWKTVFEHLLSNARFALAPGGKLRVALHQENLTEDRARQLGLSTREAMQFIVSDTGFGMEPQILDRAFEPFFTTRTMIKAPGLGLTIIHGIVQFHGGQVELHSKPQEGTTVTIWVPAISPIALSSRERLASVGGTFNAPARPKQKVLLLATDPSLVEVLKMWGSNCGYDLQAFASPADTLKALQRSPEDVIAVLLDCAK